MYPGKKNVQQGARFSEDFTTSVQKGKTCSSMSLQLGMLLSGKLISETWIQQSYIKEKTISFLLAKMFIYLVHNSLIAKVFFTILSFQCKPLSFSENYFFSKNALKQT